jgi:hypothetical protein
MFSSGRYIMSVVYTGCNLASLSDHSCILLLVCMKKYNCELLGTF